MNETACLTRHTAVVLFIQASRGLSGKAASEVNLEEALA